MIFLETSVCIEILNGNRIFEHLTEKYKTHVFGITAPTIFELYYGIYKLKFLKKDLAPQKFEKLKKDLEDFISKLNVFPLTETSAELAAKIHLQLKGQGYEVETFDCLIAGVVLASGYSQVLTNNVEHFNRIEGLELVPRE